MHNKKLLLIVDDNSINRKILCKFLCDEYNIIEAENGSIALDVLKAEKENVSAILLDLNMPVMNGFEVMKIMNHDPLLTQIPVIVMTGSNDDDTEDKALSLGANDFIIKPYKPSIIRHRINNTINLRETAAFVNTVQHDKLTGLLKKEFFCKQIESVLKSNPTIKYDLICGDIERFRLVNDLYGVNLGDDLLKHIAGLITTEFPDAIISGRIGIDQFACLVQHREHYDNGSFEKAVTRINRFPVSINLKMCYGIYTIHDSTIPANAMCDRAVIACNSVKGKYGVYFSFYDDNIRQKLLAEQNIIDNMKSALKANEFQVYYQPKYDVSTEKIAGAEALVRWVHPGEAPVSPADFIPIFEKNGFITELDYYVWETVCKMISDRVHHGKTITPVSVNVSRADVYNSDLPNMLQNLIKKYNVSPNYLHLEITESAYTENPEQLIEVVGKLKSFGFIIEMDDFGSGYSSLSMLSCLPLDVLKLDMEFVKNETSKNSSKNILSFVISLAKWLNLSIVAEGVETKDQLDILRHMDCTYVQGYYYSKPLPVNEFFKHLEKNEVALLNAKKTPRYTDNEITVSPNQSGRIMMIVDDVELNREILSEIFSKSFSIAQASNGESAYKFAQKNYELIDIILLDLVMPVMDGFQLLSKLKSNANLKNIPVIITSQAGENSEARALAMGAADFIAKPYNTDVALHRVNNVMAQSKLSIIEREKALSEEVEAMRYKAEHDQLTGLFNRTALETQINNYFADITHSHGGFFMIDLDNFKTVNDVYGHDKGDDVLVSVAKILSGIFTEKDIVSRLGGDEFAVFVPHSKSLLSLKRYANTICKKLQIKYSGVSLSATVGISASPAQGTDYQTLYKNADTALLAAKRTGKNQYKMFDDEMEMPSPVLSRNLDWLLDETSDGIVVCDAENFDILYMNHIACEIVGKNKKDNMGKKCYDVIWNNKSPCSHCVSLDKMSRNYCEHEVTDKINNKHYIIKGKLTEWGGKPARIQFIQDNTSRATIAKQLELISTDRKRLLDLMPGGIFRYSADQNDHFDFISENMLKMLGYTRDDFISKFDNSFAKMVWHEDRERVLREIDSQIELGDYDECDYRIEKADGSLCWVHDLGHLVYDQYGRPWFYVNIIDVTAEHNMSEKLTEEQNKLKIALSHSGLQFWEHNLLNDICYNGIHNAELGFQDVTENYSEFIQNSGMVPKEYLPLYLENQQKLYDGAKRVEYDIPLINPDGHPIWWHICCTNIFDENGKPIKTIGTAENINQLKEYEKDIADGKKLD